MVSARTDFLHYQHRPGQVQHLYCLAAHHHTTQVPIWFILHHGTVGVRLVGHGHHPPHLVQAGFGHLGSLGGHLWRRVHRHQHQLLHFRRHHRHRLGMCPPAWIHPVGGPDEDPGQDFVDRGSVARSAVSWLPSRSPLEYVCP